MQGTDDPGETNTSDFHDSLLTGSISWEKRTSGSNPALLAGATFTVTPNPLTGIGVLTVVDGGANDADGLANGVFKVNNALPGTYTITETVPPVGYALDPVPTRIVTVTLAATSPRSSASKAPTIRARPTRPTSTTACSPAASRGRSGPAGSNPTLLAGATFTVTPNPLTGVGVLTVVDGGANDADGLANGVFKVNNALPGTYTITETVPGRLRPRPRADAGRHRHAGAPHPGHRRARHRRSGRDQHVRLPRQRNC